MRNPKSLLAHGLATLLLLGGGLMFLGSSTAYARWDRHDERRALKEQRKEQRRLEREWDRRESRRMWREERFYNPYASRYHYYYNYPQTYVYPAYPYTRAYPGYYYPDTRYRRDFRIYIRP